MTVRNTLASWVIGLGLASGAGCYGGGEIAPTDPGAGASAPGATNAGDAPTTCTSGQTVPIMTGDGTAGMNPGQACIACHSQGEGPRFLVAGTVYASAHEWNNCVSTTGGVQVIITDATGKDFPVTANSTGNFYLQSSRKNPVTFTMPYTARIERNGQTTQMHTAQSTGDCNSCHTEQGANGAPGRIVAP